MSELQPEMVLMSMEGQKLGPGGEGSELRMALSSGHRSVPLQCPGHLTRSPRSFLLSDKCTLCWLCPFSVPMLL